MTAANVNIKTLPSTKYVYFKLDTAYFAIEAERVQDVVLKQQVTPVPLSPTQVIGLYNLRGKIVTCVDMKSILGLTSYEGGDIPMFLVLNTGTELYSFPVDQVFNTMDVVDMQIKPAPGNVNSAWVNLCKGVTNKDNNLVVLLDFQSICSAIFSIGGVTYGG